MFKIETKGITHIKYNDKHPISRSVVSLVTEVSVYLSNLHPLKYPSFPLGNPEKLDRQNLEIHEVRLRRLNLSHTRMNALNEPTQQRQTNKTQLLYLCSHCSL